MKSHTKSLLAKIEKLLQLMRVTHKPRFLPLWILSMQMLIPELKVRLTLFDILFQKVYYYVYVLKFKIKIHFILIGVSVNHWMEKERQKHDQGTTESLCLPFFSILLALGNPYVDYFSLDVEGSELSILKTIPWEEVKIKVGYWVILCATTY